MSLLGRVLTLIESTDVELKNGRALLIDLCRNANLLGSENAAHKALIVVNEESLGAVISGPDRRVVLSLLIVKLRENGAAVVGPAEE